jgi:hypothetical protein
MNLSKLVIDKIEELKIPEAARYFKVSVPTIYSWKKNGNPPISAVQKVMDDVDGFTATEEQAVITPEAVVTEEPQAVTEEPPVVASEQVTAEEPVVVADPSTVTGLLESHEYRIRKLEMAVASQYDAARAQRPTSLIRPVSPPHSGMAIKDAPRIIGEIPKPKHAPANWNEAKNPPTASGWNTPIKPQSPERAGWNAEFPKEK